MVGPIKEWETELIRKVQKGKANVDIKTGEVYAVPGELTNGNYLGTLRRKLIPDRRNLEMQEKSKLELNLEITDIKDWLIGNPHECVDIECEGKLIDSKGNFCPVMIKLYDRRAAKLVGIPLEFNKDYGADSISRNIIGKKYVLKIYEK